MRNSRLSEMERVIAQYGTVSMVKLCELFDVSMNTVRRDVMELKRRGVIQKVYGGVCAAETGTRPLRSFEDRQKISDEAKRAICRKAATLIDDGDIIFADSGTTIMHLPEELAGHREVTIVTNNLALVACAMPYENLNVIVLPGQLQRRTNSLTGMETTRAMERFNIRKAFLAATGSTLSGVTNSSPPEYEIKRAVIEKVPLHYLLLCRDKFGHSGLMTYANFEDFNGIVTDCPLEEPYLSQVERADVRVYVANND